jgi:hypothetical protein
VKTQAINLLTIAHDKRVQKQLIEPNPFQTRPSGGLEIEQAITHEQVWACSDIPHPYRGIETDGAGEPLPSGCRLKPTRKLTNISLVDSASSGVLVRPDVARKQMDTETLMDPDREAPPKPPGGGEEPVPPPGGGTITPAPSVARPTRFHGTVTVDAARVGRDAGRIAEEVIAHVTRLVGARGTVTIEVEAEIPAGAPENVVRTVTENSRTLGFTSHGFETG